MGGIVDGHRLRDAPRAASVRAARTRRRAWASAITREASWGAALFVALGATNVSASGLYGPPSAPAPEEATAAEAASVEAPSATASVGIPAAPAVVGATTERSPATPTRVREAKPSRRERPAIAHPDRASAEHPPPRDPDQTPFLRPPLGQLGRWSTTRDGAAITRGFRPRQRATLSVAPVFASIPSPLRGREDGARAGGGVSVSADVYVARWLAIHLDGSHTAHPVGEGTRTDDAGNTTTSALAGRYGVSQGTLGLLYLIDVGRVVPSLEAGAGVSYVTSPEGVVSGQRGRSCTADAACDFGLACVANRCVPRPAPHVAAGIAVDVRLGRRWAVGGFVRYYAALTNVAQFPVYLVTGLRATFRF